jgi:hypothetical protein
VKDGNTQCVEYNTHFKDGDRAENDYVVRVEGAGNKQHVTGIFTVNPDGNLVPVSMGDSLVKADGSGTVVASSDADKIKAMIRDNVGITPPAAHATVTATGPGKHSPETHQAASPQSDIEKKAGQILHDVLNGLPGGMLPTTNHFSGAHHSGAHHRPHRAAMPSTVPVGIAAGNPVHRATVDKAPAHEEGTHPATAKPPAANPVTQTQKTAQHKSPVSPAAKFGGTPGIC